MKSKTLLLLVILSISILSVAAYNRDDYWECTSRGEASQGDAFGRRIGEVCNNDCCKLCVSPDVFQDCLGSEAQPQCQCTGGNPNDFQPPTITILSPQPISYSTDDILINVQTDEPAAIKRRLDSGSLTSMCSSCNSAQYLKTNIDDGIHTLYIEAKDQNNNKANKTIYFTVDTMPPVITSTKPSDASYVNNSINEFSVSYTENNIVSVKLYYKGAVEPSYNMVSLTGCESGASKLCEKLVNLNSYAQGTVLSYYFTISDASSTATSATSQVTINDASALLPFIIIYPINNSIIGAKSVPFDLSTSELSSFYYSTDSIKFNKLCTSCSKYSKNITSIKDGIYDIVIRMIDSKGTHDRYIHIMKDTVKPKIKSTKPVKDETINNGNFSVEYVEYNTNEVSLHYGPTGFENIVTSTSCPSGKKASCVFDGINLAAYDGQQIKYWFNVSDYIITVGSKAITLNVDTTSPVLTANNPTVSGTYDNSITFNIQSSEPVYLELSDNGGKFSKLCSDCTSYTSKKSFTLGAHSLIIKATDPAGNTDQKAINVMIY